MNNCKSSKVAQRTTSNSTYRIIILTFATTTRLDYSILLHLQVRKQNIQWSTFTPSPVTGNCHQNCNDMKNVPVICRCKTYMENFTTCSKRNWKFLMLGAHFLHLEKIQISSYLNRAVTYSNIKLNRLGQTHWYPVLITQTNALALSYRLGDVPVRLRVPLSFFSVTLVVQIYLYTRAPPHSMCANPEKGQDGHQLMQCHIPNIKTLDARMNAHRLSSLDWMVRQRKMSWWSKVSFLSWHDMWYLVRESFLSLALALVYE